MKDKIKNILIFILGITISITGSVIANTLIKSSDVVYDNAKSGIEATTVQGALDELYSAATDYSTLSNKVNSLKTEIIDAIYPKGSIYMSTTEDTIEKVQARFGGTWERYAEGRTLIGVGTGTDSNGTAKVFNKNESAGEYNHTLTVSEMPRHNHIENFPYEGVIEMGYPSYLNGSTKHYIINNIVYSRIDLTTYTLGNYYPITTIDEGSSQSHNNIQPYITVYMYKRVN